MTSAQQWNFSSIRLFLIALMLICFQPRSSAQDKTCSGFDPHCFTFDAGVGFSPLLGDLNRRLDNGWHIAVGGGYHFTSSFATTLEYTYNGYGVSGGVLREAQVPDGNAHMWSLTLNPKLRFNNAGRFNPYVVGRVGFYRRTVEFTSPSVASVFFFDPFFGVFFNTLVPAKQVLGDIRRSGAGGGLGVGFDQKIGDTNTKFFTELRYEYADTGRIPTRMLPVTVGFRW